MKTVFIRAIEATVDEKAALIREAASGASPVRFEADLSTFGKVPRSPFAYWAGDAVRACSFDGVKHAAVHGNFSGHGVTIDADSAALRIVAR